MIKFQEIVLVFYVHELQLIIVYKTAKTTLNRIKRKVEKYKNSKWLKIFYFIRKISKEIDRILILIIPLIQIITRHYNFLATYQKIENYSKYAN